MDTTVEAEDRTPWQAFLESRGFAIFMTFLSCFALYGRTRHASARFNAPHYILIRHDLFGSIGWAVDLFVYSVVAYLVFSLQESASDRVEKAVFIGLGGPLLINPVNAGSEGTPPRFGGSSYASW